MKLLARESRMPVLLAGASAAALLAPLLDDGLGGVLGTGVLSLVLGVGLFHALRRSGGNKR